MGSLPLGHWLRQLVQGFSHPLVVACYPVGVFPWQCRMLAHVASPLPACRPVLWEVLFLPSLMFISWRDAAPRLGRWPVGLLPFCFVQLWRLPAGGLAVSAALGASGLWPFAPFEAPLWCVPRALWAVWLSLAAPARFPGLPLGGHAPWGRSHRPRMPGPPSGLGPSSVPRRKCAWHLPPTVKGLPASVAAVPQGFFGPPPLAGDAAASLPVASAGTEAGWLAWWGLDKAGVGISGPLHRPHAVRTLLLAKASVRHSRIGVSATCTSTDVPHAAVLVFPPGGGSRPCQGLRTHALGDSFPENLGHGRWAIMLGRLFLAPPAIARLSLVGGSECVWRQLPHGTSSLKVGGPACTGIRKCRIQRGFYPHVAAVEAGRKPQSMAQDFGRWPVRAWRG